MSNLSQSTKVVSYTGLAYALNGWYHVCQMKASPEKAMAVHRMNMFSVRLAWGAWLAWLTLRFSNTKLPSRDRHDLLWAMGALHALLHEIFDFFS